MRDLDREIIELSEATARNRHEFVRAELQSCAISVDMARYQFSVGNLAFAKKEIVVTERGIQILQRFVSQISPEERALVEESIAQLQAAMEQIKQGMSR